MSESSSYPNGRDFCGYARFIAHAKEYGRRYGYGRDIETGAIGLFVETPGVTPRGRYSRKKHPVLMRATGTMRATSTEIVWK